jgi:hypothetical protein
MIRTANAIIENIYVKEIINDTDNSKLIVIKENNPKKVIK